MSSRTYGIPRRDFFIDSNDPWQVGLSVRARHNKYDKIIQEEETEREKKRKDKADAHRYALMYAHFFAYSDENTEWRKKCPIIKKPIKKPKDESKSVQQNNFEPRKLYLGTWVRRDGNPYWYVIVGATQTEYITKRTHSRSEETGLPGTDRVLDHGRYLQLRNVIGFMDADDIKIKKDNITEHRVFGPKYVSIIPKYDRFATPTNSNTYFTYLKDWFNKL